MGADELAFAIDELDRQLLAGVVLVALLVDHDHLDELGHRRNVLVQVDHVLVGVTLAATEPVPDVLVQDVLLHRALVLAHTEPVPDVLDLTARDLEEHLRRHKQSPSRN